MTGQNALRRSLALRPLGGEWEYCPIQGSIVEVMLMQYVVKLERVGARPIAVVRRRAAPHELSKVVPDACGTVWNVIRSQNVSGAGRHVAVYLDGQINLEVGVELHGPFSGYGEVVASAIPA